MMLLSQHKIRINDGNNQNHTLWVELLSVVRIDRIIATTLTHQSNNNASLNYGTEFVFSSPMADDDEMIALVQVFLQA